MKINISKYIELSREKIEQGISVEEILVFHRMEKLPPGFSKIILVNILGVSYDEAQQMIVNSKAYADLVREPNPFLDHFMDNLDKEE